MCVLWVIGLISMVAQVASAEADPPRRKGPLLDWLTAGTYRASYTPEPEVHVSTSGAHGLNVRTYYSPVLVEDLRASRSVFRRGAAMVKELYFGGGDEVIGYAVMTKVRHRRRAVGRAWLFYETLDGTNANPSFGRNLPVCSGCHRAGVDFLRSEFRP